MASEPHPKRAINLMSYDGSRYLVEEAELRLIPALARSLDEATPAVDVCFFIPYLKSETVRKIVDYCRKHAAPADANAAAGNDEDLGAWDSTFVDVPHAQILDLLMAGNNLGIQSLCDICCDKIVANTTKAYEDSKQKEQNKTG